MPKKCSTFLEKKSMQFVINLCYIVSIIYRNKQHTLSEKIIFNDHIVHFHQTIINFGQYEDAQKQLL